MVQTTKDMGVAERIARLREKKKKEEDEIKVLEQKKKELEEIDKELKTAEGLEAEQRAGEEIHALKNNNRALEEIVADQPESEHVKEETAPVTYLTEGLRADQADIYSLTNYNVYNRLRDIRDRVSQGNEITREESDFVYEVHKQAERFETDYLAQKDPYDYVHRSEDVLKQIDNFLYLRKTR